jgi:hypothetical protein
MMTACVFGCASRAGYLRTRNAPNPWIETSPSPLRPAAIAAVTATTARSASALLDPIWRATDSTRSALFIASSPGGAHATARRPRGGGMVADASGGANGRLRR